MGISDIQFKSVFWTLVVLFAIAVAWFTGNLLYTVLWAVLAKWGFPITEAKMTAYIVANLVPFGLILLLGAILYFFIRHHITRAAFANDQTRDDPSAKLILAQAELAKQYRLQDKQDLRRAAMALGMPNWKLHDLFLHIDPNVFEADKKFRVGRDVKDKLSTGQLKSWGRQIEGSRRLALAPIPAEFWKDASFTYFPPDGDNSSVWDARSATGSDYGDVQVNRAEAEAIWPKSPSQEPRLVPARLAIARALDELNAEGVVHRNALIPAIKGFDYDLARQTLIDWDRRVLAELNDEYVAMREKSAFRTLDRFEPEFHKAEGKSSEQERLEAMWNEKLNRLKIIIRKVGS